VRVHRTTSSSASASQRSIALLVSWSETMTSGPYAASGQIG
jgi:hypothetical protein